MIAKFPESISEIERLVAISLVQDDAIRKVKLSPVMSLKGDGKADTGRVRFKSELYSERDAWLIKCAQCNVERLNSKKGCVSSYRYKRRSEEYL